MVHFLDRREASSFLRPRAAASLKQVCEIYSFCRSIKGALHTLAREGVILALGIGASRPAGGGAGVIPHWHLQVIRGALIALSVGERQNYQRGTDFKVCAFQSLER